MTLKSAKVTNLQSILSAEFHFPEYGLVRFLGDNSNGKSIIQKTITKVLSGEIRRPMSRKSIVNWDPDTPWWSELEMTSYDDMRLIIHIDLESKNTWSELTLPNQAPIRRYLADKNMIELVNKFGWHYNEKRGISLNVCDGDADVLFFRTSFACNFDIVDPTINDEAAIRALANMEEVQKSATETRTKMRNEIVISETTKANLKIYDIDKESRRKAQLEYYYKNLNGIHFPILPEVPEIHDVTIIEMHEPRFPDIKSVTVWDFRLSIPDIIETGTKLASLQKGVCPVCKRTLVDSNHSHSPFQS